MVLLAIDVGNDVIIAIGVSLGSEVPRLFFGVVFALFKSFELVFEVQDIVSLFVAKCAVSILCQSVSHALLLGHPLMLFPSLVPVDLGYWVVNSFVFLNKLVGHLFIGLSYSLEIPFLIHIGAHILAPLQVTVRQLVL